MRPYKLIPLFVAIVSAMTTFAAPTENCTSTTFSTLAATSCKGAFNGNIDGAQAETTYLSGLGGDWLGSYVYWGKSDDTGNGPFTSNPNGTGGTLTFDQAISGKFVIGLKASNNYSYYLFNAATPLTSLTFDTTAGIAVNNVGNPQGLSHASLYVASVPEPETYAMLLAGFGLICGIARRRKQKNIPA